MENEQIINELFLKFHYNEISYDDIEDITYTQFFKLKDEYKKTKSIPIMDRAKVLKFIFQTRTTYCLVNTKEYWNDNVIWKYIFTTAFDGYLDGDLYTGIRKKVEYDALSAEIFCDVCKEGNISKVLEYMENKPDECKITEGLAIGCRRGHKDLVKLMIEKGATNFEEGLANACCGGHKKLVKLMIKKGADNWGEALFKSCIYKQKEIAIMIIEQGGHHKSIVDPSKTLIDYCNLKLDKEDVLKLQKKGIPIGKFKEMCNIE